MTLFEHKLHPHIPTNVNITHRQEQVSGGFNMQTALKLTKIFQAMSTFWVIFAWIVLWILFNATILHFDPAPWPLLLCLASVPQLPLMVVIMVGQGLLGRHQELQADETYQTTAKIYDDISQMIAHMNAQDEELIKHRELLEGKK